MKDVAITSVGTNSCSSAFRLWAWFSLSPRMSGSSSLSRRPFTFQLSPFTSRIRSTQRLLLLLCFLALSSTAHAAGGPTGLAYPVDPASYHDDDVSFMPAKLWGRIQSEPLNLIATVIFALAILHTFLAAQFQKRSHSFEHRLLRLEEEAADPNVTVPNEKRDHLTFWAQFYHFMEIGRASCRERV